MKLEEKACDQSPSEDISNSDQSSAPSLSCDNLDKSNDNYDQYSDSDNVYQSSDNPYQSSDSEKPIGSDDTPSEPLATKPHQETDTVQSVDSVSCHQNGDETTSNDHTDV